MGLGRPYFSIDKEPIFDSILRNMVLGHAVNLKKKARIKIKDGCVLIGVIDEKGLLNPGEVLIRIQPQSYEINDEFENLVSEIQSAEERKLKKEILGANFQVTTVEGLVMVTKNPCSHPGDIRLLTAIGETDPRFYELQDLVNVIVFSSKGERPEQHKMSGGDLDGDVYLAMWDKLIVEDLNKVKIKEPANYKKYVDDKALTSKNIEDHIKVYFEKDNLGHLSNMHLALADQAGK